MWDVLSVRGSNYCRNTFDTNDAAMLPAHKLHNYAIALVKVAVVLVTTNLASLAAPVLPVKPPPSWVELTSPDTNSKALVDEALGGILCLLADQQYRRSVAI